MLFDNPSDPDLHFYNNDIQILNTPSIMHEEHKIFLGDDKNKIVCFAPLYKKH